MEAEVPVRLEEAERAATGAASVGRPEASAMSPPPALLLDRLQRGSSKTSRTLHSTEALDEAGAAVSDLLASQRVGN